MALPNEVTLSVDVDGDGLTPVDELFENARRQDYKGEYIGENHTSLMRDTMTTYYTPPKPTSAFYGVDKAAIKFSMDVDVPTPTGVNTRSPVIFQLSGSVPVGASDADKVHVVQRVRAFVHSDHFLDLMRGMV